MYSDESAPWKQQQAAVSFPPPRTTNHACPKAASHPIKDRRYRRQRLSPIHHSPVDIASTSVMPLDPNVPDRIRLRLVVVAAVVALARRQDEVGAGAVAAVAAAGRWRREEKVSMVGLVGGGVHRLSYR